MKHEIKFLDGRPPLVGDASSFKAFVVKNKAYLSGANLSGADLGRADLGGANLRGAYLSGADLAGADLGRADLRGANLRGADLGGADLGGADLGGADLGGAVGIAPFMSPTSGRICYVVDHGDITMAKLGCFWDSIRQAEIEIRKKRPTDVADIYIAAMRSAEAVMKYRSKK